MYDVMLHLKCFNKVYCQICNLNYVIFFKVFEPPVSSRHLFVASLWLLPVYCHSVLARETCPRLMSLLFKTLLELVATLSHPQEFFKILLHASWRPGPK